ncbi:MAG TPA: alkaline phosphatase [Gammaproteobacteria bacterium]|nr:alkaline phosphatase [Gammaproteobacteria bacterium]
MPQRKFLNRKRSLQATSIALILCGQSAQAFDVKHDHYFERISSFPVFLNTDIDLETVAEIVAVSDDGKTLIYTDSETEKAGFVNIHNPYQPQAAGTVDLNGEPTSVAVAGKYALVAVNTSTNFVNTSGELVVINIRTKKVVATHRIGGQPDSIAVSPNQKYAAIAVENERDEDLGNGEPPQAPAGYLTILDLIGPPTNWSQRQVDFSGVADLFPDDAEPEYVSINKKNEAVVTLQENNHIILVDLKKGQITGDFSAGIVELTQIDTNENDLIELNSGLSEIPREPDGVTWINPWLFATADEGDLFGGSRGFTLFNTAGEIKFTSAESMDHTAARVGHYPEDRSENKGNEPENVAYARYGKEALLFVGSERANLTFVYELVGKQKQPQFKQVLPTGVGPEGLLPIPRRNLLVVASEKDDRGDRFRSVLTIYKQFYRQHPSYPTIASTHRADGTPIPWGALSGLAIDKQNPKVGYSIHDSFYKRSRIFTMENGHPVRIIDELQLLDSMGKLATVDASLVNGDGSVNLDLEGIATTTAGHFWLVSEGRGTVGDVDRPFETLNLLIKASASGVIEKVISLPESTNARQVRFGLEGVTVVEAGATEHIFVAFQRQWAEDPDGLVRIGQYNTQSQQWRFFYYPIEAPLSANGGWVGLSEIAALGNDRFAVIERDNQGGPDAVIKRIYEFSVAGLTPLADPALGTTPSFPVVTKTLVRNLMPDLHSLGGQVLEKIEGLAISPNGTAIVVNDNDGVDDSNGETQLLKFPKLFQ